MEEETGPVRGLEPLRGLRPQPQPKGHYWGLGALLGVVLVAAACYGAARYVPYLYRHIAPAVAVQHAPAKRTPAPSPRLTPQFEALPVATPHPVTTKTVTVIAKPRKTVQPSPAATATPPPVTPPAPTPTPTATPSPSPSPTAVPSPAPSPTD